MERQFIGVKVHPATMSRALRQIGARRGRPKPTVGCPWSKTAKNRRIAAIGSVLRTLSPNEVAVYLDDGNDPAQLARHVVTLYRDPVLWQTLRDNALARLAVENGREHYVQALTTILGL